MAPVGSRMTPRLRLVVNNDYEVPLDLVDEVPAGTAFRRP